MLLAIDTATRQAGLALCTRDKLLTEMIWEAGRHHTVEMAPALDDAFARTDTSPVDLTAVAVTIGPGSFTGLRIGMSLAKGYAIAHELKLIGIPTLDVTMTPHAFHAYDTTPLCATLQAGRGRLSYAFYAPDASGEWSRRGDFKLGRVAELGERLEEPTRVVGELRPADRDWLREHAPDRALLSSPVMTVRRPAILAELAWQRLDAGDVDDIDSLAPIYLHISDTES